ncbi:MAG: hypothetical protein ACREDY_01330 [Bradyrhizobium sp.]
MNVATAAALEDLTEVDDMDAVVDLAIRRFLVGGSDGHALFEALYGDVLEEPIPESMLALIRGR